MFAGPLTDPHQAALQRRVGHGKDKGASSADAGVQQPLLPSLRRGSKQVIAALDQSSSHQKAVVKASACHDLLMVHLQRRTRLSRSQKPTLLLQVPGYTQPQLKSQPGPALQSISLTLSRGSLTVLHGEVGAGQSVCCP